MFEYGREGIFSRDHCDNDLRVCLLAQIKYKFVEFLGMEAYDKGIVGRRMALQDRWLFA